MTKEELIEIHPSSFVTNFPLGLLENNIAKSEQEIKFPRFTQPPLPGNKHSLARSYPFSLQSPSS